MSHDHTHGPDYHGLDVLGQTGDPAGERWEDFSRRSFLKLAGFTFAGGLAGALASGCAEGRMENAIPMLQGVEEITPGSPYWFAGACLACNAGCGIVAKNRDGRPVKLEGNAAHPLSKGGMCAVGQASILELYDSYRLKGPQIGGSAATWTKVDAEIAAALRPFEQGGAVRLLTGTITSPTARAEIARFLARFKDARHVEYDPISVSAILDAHERTHGVRALPRYRFDAATEIVSFDADFLGTWISPVEFAKAYRAARSLEGTPPRWAHHVQVESRMSLTGSSADERLVVPPAAVAAMIEWVAASLSARVGTVSPGSASPGSASPGSASPGSAAPGAAVAPSLPPLAPELEPGARAIVERLASARGRALVVAGTNSVRAQAMVNLINETLGAYGATLDLARPSLQCRGSDAALAELLEDAVTGRVGALLVFGNPVYDLPRGRELADAMRRMKLTVSFNEHADETGAAAMYRCPVPHPLEAWNDLEPTAGLFSVAQPSVRPLRDARTMCESLRRWGGAPATAYELIRAHWERSVFPRAGGGQPFDAFWNAALERGFVEVTPEAAASVPASVPAFDRGAIAALPAAVPPPAVQPPAVQPAANVFDVVLHASYTMLDGRNAHNPWLHELPDPITKIVWDNYASIAPEAAERLGIVEGAVVRVASASAASASAASASDASGSAASRAVFLPAHIQRGQHPGVIAIALGYGRAGTDRFTNVGPDWLQAQPTVSPGMTVGASAAGLLRFADGHLAYTDRVTLSVTGDVAVLAASQEFDSLQNPTLLGSEGGAEEREIVQRATLAAYAANPAAGAFAKPALESMWDSHAYTGHRWAMAVDLTACTGCAACVIACQAENNIPVVGRDEVRRNREMHWIRIDRYYSGHGEATRVSHQPMMCQHCEHAPCETVCPVVATVHSAEGLNQQAYNRCVGTRYCSNNCPYKVRHFNWFQYPRGDSLRAMVLNPDVTVRDRGVMEKCSMCVQRIQLAKIEAKRDGRSVRDGDIATACQQTCPADAIIFGDMNDRSSRISAAIRDPRYYRVLEEIGVRPAVGYLTQVRDRAEAVAGGGNQTHTAGGAHNG